MELPRSVGRAGERVVARRVAERGAGGAGGRLSSRERFPCSETALARRGADGAVPARHLGDRARSRRLRHARPRFALPAPVCGRGAAAAIGSVHPRVGVSLVLARQGCSGGVDGLAAGAPRRWLGAASDRCARRSAVLAPLRSARHADERRTRGAWRRAARWWTPAASVIDLEPARACDPMILDQLLIATGPPSRPDRAYDRHSRAAVDRPAGAASGPPLAPSPRRRSGASASSGPRPTQRGGRSRSDEPSARVARRYQPGKVGRRRSGSWWRRCPASRQLPAVNPPSPAPAAERVARL